MRAWKVRITYLMLLSMVLQTLAVRPATAATPIFGRIFRLEYEKWYHGTPPEEMCSDDAIQQLAENIDWLEHHIDKYGSVVTKAPDVWGESRWTRHRFEYERELAKKLTEFDVALNGSLRRSDQAFLGMALSLQAVAEGSKTATLPSSSTQTSKDGVVTSSSFGQVNSMIQMPYPVLSADGKTVLTPGVITPTPIYSTTPTAALFPDPALSLEPTIQLDQLSRYINHLHELRRINEGDDIGDSPGYSLNLVRIPVSVLPGKLTQTGFGAEVTVIAESYLGPDLLPTTFRTLVIQDLVDMLAPLITHVVNQPDFPLPDAELPSEPDEVPRAPNDRKTLRSQANLGYAAQAAMDVVQREQPVTSQTSPVLNSRRARIAIPPSQVRDIIGPREITLLAQQVKIGLQQEPQSQPNIDLMDVRAYLRAELDAAYEFLSTSENMTLWEHHCTEQLATVIRSHRVPSVDLLRRSFMCNLGKEKTSPWPADSLGPPLPTPTEVLPPGETLLDRAAITAPLPQCASPQAALLYHLPPTETCCNEQFPQRSICDTATGALAWAVIVESTLLNQRLQDDIRETAGLKGVPLPTDVCLPFFGPSPPPESRDLFNEYVRHRWPIHVFALDPVNQEQNIADEFSRRRELQIALSLAFAADNLSAQALMRHTRRIEWDMATIALNRTSVGFSHGNDTFGWRLYPRYQTPPVSTGIAAFGETLFGGPSRDHDLNKRQIEPGTRECTAIVVMPSFVPYVTFDVRTNWFKLSNPKNAALTMKSTMKLSRAIAAMQQSRAQCAECQVCYREGEVQRLMRRVDQLDRELPLQTMQVQIPYENTAGGFEVFNSGVTELAPELIGWYGAPGINPEGPTEMFLVGDGFSVHDSQIIAGGQPAQVELISRQLMKVVLPGGLQVVHCIHSPQDSQGDEHLAVDVHLATSYGVSSHLLIPVAKYGQHTAPAQPDTGISFDDVGNFAFTYKAEQDSNTRKWTVTLDDTLDPVSGVIKIKVPPFANQRAEGIFVFQLTDTKTKVDTFRVTAVPFNPFELRYEVSGAAPTSPLTVFKATAKTIAKQRLEALLNSGNDPGPSYKVAVSAALIDANGGPMAPLQNTFEIEFIKRAP